MLALISQLWDNISLAGTTTGQTRREKNGIILFNRAWLLIMLIESSCVISHLINGLYRSAFITAAFVGTWYLIHVLVRRGKMNEAKMLVLVLSICDILMESVFFGAQTRIIDFLLLTALLPLYFFESKNTKLIFAGTVMSLVPFAIYHFASPYLGVYGLPLNEQMNLYNSAIWEKICCLVVLLFLIYNKNANYEKEALEKESQLIEQKKLYECILEQIPIDIVTFDKELKFTYANSSAVEDPVMRKAIIGKSNAEYAEKHKMALHVAVERDRVLQEALETESLVKLEETSADKHGRLKYFLKGVSPIYGENKQEVSCLVGYSLDITGIKEAEQKLKEYSNELERKNADLHHFVNATSHDLKSPLRNIASYLQLLERKNHGHLDEESVSLISYTVKAVKHLNQLIGDIYQYSVADRNDKPVENTDLNKVLDDALKQMESTIVGKKAEIRHSPLPVLKVAPAHLNMVFSNLVGNAIKYNNSTVPQIMISCKTTDKEHIISVTDNGIGIAKEYSKQIFEIFQRLHTPDEYEGTGVGLAICSKIAENYGGRIWVESKPGSGSTFYFTVLRELVDADKAECLKISSFKTLAIAR